MVQKQSGFTLIEMVIVMGIASVLFLVSYQNLFRTQYQANLSNSISAFIADVRKQQLLAMNGATEDGDSQPANYGVYIAQNRYTLFKGVYDPANTLNRTVNLDYPILFSAVQLPSSVLLFASGSGELVGFDPMNSWVTISNDIQNVSKTVQFNPYGIPTQVQ